MHFKHLGLFLFSLFFAQSLWAQYLTPVTHFHAKNSPYCKYSDNFLSGFVQGVDFNAQDGFLQMPFVGDPLLIYVGEKDSTQYTAYASGYKINSDENDSRKYLVDYLRYRVEGRLNAHPAYVEQEYTYPDTLADKGFLLDLDHFTTGIGREDLDVKLVDKYTLRASRRSVAHGEASQLFYIARFSHPFATWNIRREFVKLENGTKEPRCKVALTFNLKPKEKLTVASAVSKIGSDKAFAQLEGHAPARYAEGNSSASRIIYHFDDTPSKSSARNLVQRTSAKRSKVTSKSGRSVVNKANTDNAVDMIELTTRDANMRAAFSSAVSLLKQQLVCQGVEGADEFLKAIVPLYKNSSEADADEVKTDMLLREYGRQLFSGERSQDYVVRAAWFVFNALGFRPTSNPEEYKMVRPLFNIATLHLSNHRRLMMFVKNNSPKNIHVERMALMHQEVPADHIFTHQQLLRGGTLEVKMSRMK